MWPFSKKSTLTELERTLLTEVESNLTPSETAELFRFQIGAITNIRRNCGGKEVLFESRVPDSLRFRAEGDIVVVATIRFTVAGNNDVWKVKVRATGGRLSSIVFNLAPPEQTERSELQIQDVTLGTNLTQSIPAITAQLVSLNEIELTGWLRQWTQIRGINAVSAPLSEANRRRLATAFDVRLPADYLDLLGQCDGFVADGCSVLGLSEAYEVVLPYGNYVLIGEIHDRGFFGMRDDSDDGVVYLLDREAADKPVASYNSLQAALESIG